MTIFDYISFLTVAECKSITAAADKLHLTKSAVSHNLSKIEKELDVPLPAQERRCCPTPKK